MAFQRREKKKQSRKIHLIFNILLLLKCSTGIRFDKQRTISPPPLRRVEQRNLHLAFTTRGGGIGKRSSSSTSVQNQAQTTADKKRSTTVALIAKSTTLISFVSLAIAYRQNIKSCIDSREEIVSNLKNLILTNLQHINDLGSYGLFIYIMIFALIIEPVGVFPTSIIETTAGMAFGFEKGFLANFTGKFLGYYVAYIAGRLLLSQKINDFFDGNDLFTLVEKSITKNPLSVSLIMRFGPFPEPIKNYLLAVMPSLKISTFALACGIQGLPFSLLWSAVGNEARLQLGGAATTTTGSGDISAVSRPPPNKILPFILGFVTLFGIFGSPTLLALWINDMRKDYNTEKDEKTVRKK